jgi:ATP-dependent helicase/nuclease subunit B
VREIAEAVVYYAEDIGLCDSLSRLADSYRAIGMAAEAKKAEAGWGAVCDILDKMVEMLPEVRLDAGTFASLFLRVAAGMDVGTIPTGIDEVVLGSASGVRFDAVKYVIVLGSVYGEFPAAVNDEKTFFGERDRLALEGVGLTLSTPDREEKCTREFFMYYRTVAAAVEGLFVLTPLRDGGELSDGAARIEKIVLSEDGGSIVRSFADFSPAEAVYHPTGAEYLLSRKTGERERRILSNVAVEHDGEEMPLVAEDDVMTSCASAVKNGKLYLSQSRIETFVSCPFRYSCEYILRLKPEKKAQRHAR